MTRRERSTERGEGPTSITIYEMHRDSLYLLHKPEMVGVQLRKIMKYILDELVQTLRRYDRRVCVPQWADVHLLKK